VGVVKYETRIRDQPCGRADLSRHRRCAGPLSTKWSWLKAWAMKIARHRGIKKARFARSRPTDTSQVPASTVFNKALPSASKILDRQ
jgi:hypothetical protein